MTAARALAHITAVLQIALIIALRAVALTTARRFRRRWCRRRGGNHTVVDVLRHNPLTALVLALILQRRAVALRVRHIAIALTAARFFRRRRGRGGPQQRAVIALVERLPMTIVRVLAVIEQQTVALGEETRARRHPSLRVRRVGIAVAAARLDGRGGRLTDRVRAGIPMTARRALALILRLFAIAHVELFGIVRIAAARRDRRRRRLRGGHLALRGVLSLEPVTALIGAFVRRHSTRTLCIRFVAIAIATAGGLSGRRGRGGPFHLTVLGCDLPFTPRHHHIAFHDGRQLQTLLLRFELHARVHPSRAEIEIGAAIATANFLRRGRGRVLAVGAIARSELAFITALALIASIFGGAHFILLHALAVAAARFGRRRGRLRGGHLTVGRVIRLEPITAIHALAVALIRVCALSRVFYTLRQTASGLHRRRGRLCRGHLTLRGILRLDPRAALVLAPVLIARFVALSVGFVAIAFAAARRDGGRRGRGGRGPQQRAVVVLAERFPSAPRQSAIVGEHLTVALSVVRRARLHPSLAVRRVGVAKAAARLFGLLRRLPRTVGVLANHEMARRAAVAQIAIVFHIAFVGGALRVAGATARFFCGGWRGRRVHADIAVHITDLLTAALVRVVARERFLFADGIVATEARVAAVLVGGAGLARIGHILFEEALS